MRNAGGLHRPGRGPRALERAVRRARHPAAAGRHRRRPGRGGGNLRADRLPGTGAAQLRAGRPCHDRRVRPGRAGRGHGRAGAVLLAGARGRAVGRAARAGRPLPRRRHRGGRRLAAGPHGGLDARRHHGARRAGRRALGRQRVCDPAAEPEHRDPADDRVLHPPAGRGAGRHRAAERAVRREVRRGLRDRGQPAGLAHGPVRRQGDRRVAREGCFARDGGRDTGRAGSRRDAARVGLQWPAARHGEHAAPCLGEGSRAAVRPVPLGGHRARSRDALDRRGHGHRRHLRAGIRQEPDCGGRRAAVGRHCAAHARRPRQARGARSSARAERAGLRDCGDCGHCGVPARPRRGCRGRGGETVRRRPRDIARRGLRAAHRRRADRPGRQHPAGAGCGARRPSHPGGRPGASHPVPDHGGRRTRCRDGPARVARQRTAGAPAAGVPRRARCVDATQPCLNRRPGLCRAGAST